VVANVQTMIIGHRGFHSTLQPGLAVPHSKVWCQTEVKRRPEESSTESSFFHRRLTGWLTDWLKCCNLWEWRDRTEEFSGQALVPDKVFFSNSQNFKSCFWYVQYEHLLPMNMKFSTIFAAWLGICVDDSRFLCHVLGIWGAANDNGKNFPHEFFPSSVAHYCCCWLAPSNVRV
jgi:hypothetical protein